MLRFQVVAQVFSQIEERSGRLEMTDLLASLLKEAGKGEIGPLVYIIQGILAPPYEGIDLGLGERFAMEAISASSGYTKSQVEAHYRKSGDLGDSAEALLSKRKQTALSTIEMDVEHVFQAFLRIAKASGSGSQDQKIKILSELLNNSSPLEARYIVRFVTGNLRLGIGDPTILDALSFSRTGDKSLREEVERAYSVCSDLGHVAELFFSAPERIGEMKVQPLKPLMPALAEREDSASSIAERLGKCAVEMKYDGFRLQCHKKGQEVRLYSRKLEDMSPMFPDLVDAIRRIKAEEAIFDSEALAYDSARKRFYPFQQTMHRRRKHGIDQASKDFPLYLFVFDIMYLDGKDLTREPYAKRRKRIEKLFKGK